MLNYKSLVGVALAGLLSIVTLPAMAQPGHEGHNHPPGHSHAGAPTDLGTTSVLGMSLCVTQFGDILTSPEGIFEVKILQGNKPRAMRLWIGHESAEGSVKTKAESANNVYDVHIEIPRKLKKTSQLWIDIEPEKGKKQKVAFDVKF